MLLLRVLLLVMCLSALPVVAYVYLAGSCLNLPMGVMGFSFRYVARRQITYGRKLSRWLPRNGRTIGLDLDDRGYRLATVIDYPLLPVFIECYRGRVKVSASTSHPSN